MAKLCVALDVDKGTALELIQKLSGYGVIFKIGPKLFLESGSFVVDYVKDNGCEVFLDLKLHDIPNTVGLAVKAASDLEVSYITVHTLGGRDMLRSAVESKSKNLKILGVTVLTSHDEKYLDYIGSNFRSIKDMVLYLSEVASEEGLDGVVCSVHEAKEIKERSSMITAVPGVRLDGSRKDDQSRTATPSFASCIGADIVIMGRDIYKAPDPETVVRDVLKVL